MQRSFRWAALGLFLAAACDMTGTAAPAGGYTARKAETTPEIVAKAGELLRQNPDAKVGEELPFRLGGTRYVARVEEHDNPAGEPGRPSGKHKGITVYVAK